MVSEPKKPLKPAAWASIKVNGNPHKMKGKNKEIEHW